MPAALRLLMTQSTALCFIRSAPPGTRRRGGEAPLEPVPKSGVNLGGLRLEQWPHDFDPALPAREQLPAGKPQSWVFGMVAREFEQSLLGQPVHDPPNAAPIDSARAHRAWLRTGIKRRTLQQCLRILAGGDLHGGQLGMLGGIAAAFLAALRFGE